MMIVKPVFKTMLMLVVLMGLVGAVDDLFSLQGNVYNATGDRMPLGNLTVLMYENSTCSDWFYNSSDDFVYSIVEGQYDVMLGNETLTPLVVDPTLRYLWVGTEINGVTQIINSTGGKCRSFSSPFYMANATIDQRIDIWNTTAYTQWLNATYYSDEWWINRNTINASNYNFTFNGTRLAEEHYNKSEIHELISSLAFELFLYNTTSTEIPAYNVMNETSSEGAEQSIVVNVPADATPIQEFEANASINNLATGLYSSHVHLNATTLGVQDVRVYWEGYVRYLNGTETLLVTSEESDILTSTDAGYEIHGELDEEFAINTSSDKFVAKFYANLEGVGGNPDVWLLVEGDTFSRFELQTSADAFSSFYLRLDGSNADRNIDVQPFNFSAFWLNGLFNWTSGDDYTTFNGSTLLFNESKIPDVNVSINITGSDIFLRKDTTNDPIYNTLDAQGAIWLRSNLGNLTHNSTPQKRASAYLGVNASGGTEIGTFFNNEMTFLSRAHDFRIRQDGTINGFEFYFNRTDTEQEVFIQVWREGTDGLYDLVAQSEDLNSSIGAGAGVNNITLSNPLTGVREGDYLALSITRNPPFPQGKELMGWNVTLGATHQLPAIPGGINFNWTGLLITYQANAVVPIIALMDAPKAIFIGDSIMDGYNSNQSLRHHSFIDNRNFTALNYTSHYKIRTALDWSSQDMAVGGQNLTDEIAPRVDQDVIDMQPQVVFINGGSNDIISEKEETDFFGNYTEVLNKTQNASIFTVVLGIPPANCTSLGNFTKCDLITSWNAQLESIVDTYENAIFVDPLAYVGCLNSTGDGYEPCSDYYDDGLHFNPDGNSRLAEAMLHYAGGQRATSQFADEFIATAGMTFNELGLPVSSIYNSKTTWFGRGGGGTSVFADNAWYNQYQQTIARTDADPNAGTASALVLGDGKILFVTAEGTTDGEEIDSVFAGQHSVNRSWFRKITSSSSVFYEPDDEYREIIQVDAPTASDVEYTQDTSAFGTSHFDDMSAFDTYYYDFEGQEYLVEIDNGQLPILNITNDGLGNALFYTTTTASITGAGDQVTIYGTGTNDGAVLLPIAVFPDAFIDGFAIGNYVANSTGVWEDNVLGANSFRWSTNNGTTWNATEVPMNGTPQNLLWGTQIDFASTTNHSYGDEWRFSVVTDAFIRGYDSSGENVFDVDRYGRMRLECFDNTCVWLGEDDESEGFSIAHGDDGAGNGLTQLLDNGQWQGNINTWLARGSEPSGILFNNGEVAFYSNDGETPGAVYTPEKRAQISYTGTTFNPDNYDNDFMIDGDDINSVFKVDAGNNTVGIRTDTPGETAIIRVNGTNRTGIKFSLTDQGKGTSIGRYLDWGSYFANNMDWDGSTFSYRNDTAEAIGSGFGIIGFFINTSISAPYPKTGGLPEARYYMSTSALFPATNATYDLGLAGTAWDDVYADDYHTVGVLNYMDRDILTELTQYIPYNKTPDKWDFKKGEYTELDPESLPPLMYETTQTNEQEKKNNKDVPDEITAVRVNELVSYLYSANVQQQAKINDLENRIKELEKGG